MSLADELLADFEEIGGGEEDEEDELEGEAEGGHAAMDATDDDDQGDIPGNTHMTHNSAHTRLALTLTVTL